MNNQIQVLRSVAEIEEFRSHWVKMQWHPNSDIDFYRLVLQSMPVTTSPYVLVQWQEGEPKAILIGRIERSRLSVRIGYTTIRGPKSRQITFIYGGLLGEPSRMDCELLVTRIMDSLGAGEADVVFFNHLRTDSELYRALTQMPRFYCRDFCSSTQVHQHMSMPASVDELRKRISPKVRGTLRWRANKFVKAHSEIEIACLSKPADLDRMIRDVECIAVHTYQRGLGAGFQNSPDELKRLRMKAERGWLRTYVLYADGKPCAFWSGTLYAETFHSDFMGYDPAYRQYSPGMYLIMRVIEEFCSEGKSRQVKAIDFGLGDAEYKRMLSDQEWQDASPYIFAPTLRGAALNAYRTPLMQIDKYGRKVISTDLEAKIKRIWRDQISRKTTESAISHD